MRTKLISLLCLLCALFWLATLALTYTGRGITAKNFSAQIHVSQTTFHHDENIIVTFTIRNQSGRTFRYSRASCFMFVHIPDTNYMPIGTLAYLTGFLRMFRRNETRTIERTMGSRLPKGEHQLLAFATINAGGTRITMHATPITLTVI